MSGTAVDNVIQRLKKRREERRGAEGAATARFLVTKTSWRGSYRRLLAVTPTALVTLHPDSLAVTNTWAFAGDHDLASIDIGADGPDGGAFTLHFRKDKKGLNSRDAKYVCRERAALLTCLLDAVAAAAARGISGAAPTLLGEPETFEALKLRRGEWVGVTLRVTATALERLDPGSGAVKWRWHYAAAASPALRVLAPGDVPSGFMAFAVFSKTGRSPRVYAVRSREATIRAIQTAALRRVGVQLAVDTSVVTSLDGRQLLAAVAAAERERAASPEEAPLGEWEVLKVVDSSGGGGAGDGLSGSTDLSASVAALNAAGAKAVTPRRLVLTAHGILERRPATYEVAEWRQLPAVAALVRFADDPQWLGVEWADGAPRSVYVTPARDALAAALLYAAQAAAGRPIPVLPTPTGGADPLAAALRGQFPGEPAVAGSEEVERMLLTQVGAAATAFLAAGGADLSLNALALAGLTDVATGTVGLGGVGEGLNAAGGGGSDTHAIAALEHRLREFNASVPYAGVSTGCRVDDTLVAALLSYLPKQAAAGSQPTLGAEEARLVILSLQALQRLSAAPAVATQIVGGAGGAGRIFSALLSRHDHVAAEAARLLLRLFAPAAGRCGAPPADGGATSPLLSPQAMEDLAAARTAKSVCFISDARCATLLAPLRQQQASRSSDTAAAAPAVPTRPPSPLLAGALMEAVAAVACKPGARTTELSTREALLQEVAALGRPLFTLFNHPARQVADCAALVMQAIAEGGDAAAAPMREAALAEGAVLIHLLRALSPAGGPRAALSRHLVALWADGHDATLRLLHRIFPPGLLRLLDEPKKKAPPPPPRRLGPPDRRSMLGTAGGPVLGTGGGGHLIARSSTGSTEAPTAAAAAEGGGTVTAPPAVATASRSPTETPITALPAVSAASGDPLSAGLQAAEATTSVSALGPPPPVAERLLAGGPRHSGAPQLRGNWDAFWSAVDKDHSHAALIWNERTRSELREALTAEETALRLGRQRVADSGGASPAWNYAEFAVSYPSLASQLTIGGVHVRLLLDASNGSAGAAEEAAADLRSLVNPREFFTAAHLHFLRRGDSGLSVRSGGGHWAASDAAAERELCLRAMAAAYSVHAVEIGPFEGMQHLVDLMDQTPSRPLRHHILKLLEALVCPSPALSTSSEDSSTQQSRFRGASRAGEGRGGATAQRERALEVAQANAAALVAAGGVEILVDTVAAAHEASERPAAALQTGLIAAAPHAESVAVWHYLPKEKGSLPAGGAAGAAAAFFEEHRAGPVTKAEIRQLHSRGAVNASTPFHAAGMPEPAPLGAIRELRWWVAGGTPALTPFAAAEAALRVLSALVALRPAVDAAGEAVIPLPAAHRQMASPRCLPHLAQAVLTGEPSLVAGASSLILSLVQHNEEAMAGLYRTGIFFFLLSYCGSNWNEAASLLRASHLRQRHLGAADAAAGLPLGKRSFLGPLLPESLLYSLESYGPDAFAASLTGDADTPEVIWTHAMRGQRLVPQMLRHVGDLPRRLAERCGSVYDYTPCPPVGYPEIAEEIWCHRYYLRHLCDEGRFPNWPLVDHVPLLQALLEAWRGELARRPLGLSAAEAAAVLGLDPQNPEGITEESMKAAYRRLARKYHPDRNPEGRDRFEAVQRAYEALQSGGAGTGGPQPWRILLLLRAQCILYRRYASVLQQYKYAGYPLLLAAIELPGDSSSTAQTQQAQASNGGTASASRASEGTTAPHFLSEEVAPRLQAAAELCWLTCAASKLNGEELARSGGATLLGSLLTRCLSVLPADAAPTAPAAVLATQALRAFACMAAFPAGRAQIEGRGQQIVDDVLRAAALTKAYSAVDAALQAAVQMCRSEELQRRLLHRGAIGYFLPLLLRYDPTAAGEGGGAAAAVASTAPAALSPKKEATKAVETAPLPDIFDPDVEGDHRGPGFWGLGAAAGAAGTGPGSQQAARNHVAALAVRALAALAGYPEAKPWTPACPEAQAALAGLLTPALAPRLSDPDPRPLLRDLASSVASPAVIWNPRMRDDLETAAEAHRAAPGPAALATAAAFCHSALQGELLVEGVYARVYAEQPTFPLKDPVAFCKGLVTKVHALQQQQSDGSSGGGSGGGIEGQKGEQDAETAAETARRHLLECLAALGCVLDAHPRLMGVLSTPAALQPLVEALGPACELGHGGPMWPRFRLPGEEGSTGEAVPEERWAAVRIGVADGTAAGGSAACRAASASLAVLLRLTAHSGCVGAMAGETCLLRVLWLAHRPPSPADQAAALRLLQALSATPAAAWAAASHGGVFFLAEILLPTTLDPEEGPRAAQEAARVAAAAALACLASQPLHGPRVSLWLSKLLPPGLVAAIRDGPPESAVSALATASETPERVWTPAMAAAAAEEVAHLAAAARTAQYQSNTSEWSPGESYEMQYEALRGEMHVGGVYVRLFLKNPGHPLRSPQTFMEGLLERYAAVVGEGSGGNGGAVDVNAAVLLAAAAVAAAHHHPGLAEHGVALGYVGKLVRVLAARVPAPDGATEATSLPPPPPADDVSGSALRLLHALAAAPSSGEALARCSPPAVPVLAGALRWGGAAAVLATETLKRALAASNRSRDIIVGAALEAGLLQALLRRLDWRSGAAAANADAAAAAAAAASDESSDEAVQRVLFVDVINLLALDGVHAARVKEILDKSEIWGAYRGQRHDLFLPAGGASAQGVVGLLRGPETARFALPAPEQPAAAAAVVAAEEAPPVVVSSPPPPDAAPEPARKEEEPSAEPEPVVVAPAAMPEAVAAVPAAAEEEEEEEEAAVPEAETQPVPEADYSTATEPVETPLEPVKEPELLLPVPEPEPELTPPAEPEAPPSPAPQPPVEQPKPVYAAPEPPRVPATAPAAPPPPPQPVVPAPAAPPPVSPSRSPARPAIPQELSPTKAFSDPLSALGGGDGDDSD